MKLGEVLGRGIAQGIELAYNSGFCPTHGQDTRVVLVSGDEHERGPCFFACSECGKLLLTQGKDGRWERIAG